MGVILNEFSQGAATGEEWVELLVTSDNTNLQNYRLVDGNGSLDIRLAGSGFASLEAGTLIVLYNGGDKDSTIKPDLTYNPTLGDFSLQISSLNSTGSFAISRTTGWNNTTGAFANGSTTDVPKLLNSAGSTIFTYPRTPTPTAGQFTAYTGNTASGASSSSQWSANAASTAATPGLGNGINNLNWITSLRGTTRIRDIQGASHLSPLVGVSVSNVPGIVTARASNGFYLQDPSSDGNDATSEAIFVFTSSAPTVNVGDSVQVSGTVSEFRSGGSTSANLTITQLTSPTVSILSGGNPLPAPIVIGSGGRTPPKSIISNDAVSGSVENIGSLFDPKQDGIDFYESLEGMLVRVNNTRVVGPTSFSGETWIIPDNGNGATGKNSRGGITISANDFNPERIQIDDTLTSASPTAQVGDSLGNVTGVINYSGGNYELLSTSPLTVTRGTLARETTTITGASNQLTIAQFNVENLDPGDGTRFNSIASIIVNNLRSPDILALEEIQDNNGPTNDSVVDATTTYNTLINAIASAGGPTYQFRQINPVDDQDGGEPGGNIRIGFLFNPSRVSFTNRGSGGSLNATSAVSGGGSSGIDVTLSPGRIAPTDSAFGNSRKPLVGEFVFNGQEVFVIGNHLQARVGDDPLFGRFQPAPIQSESDRLQETQVVNNFVDSLLNINPNANIVVLGDLNDFQFSNPLSVLKGGVLTNLIDTLPANERYSFIFQGNSQAIDHILVSGNLMRNANPLIDIVHVNSEFLNPVSDHDPVLAALTLG